MEEGRETKTGGEKEERWRREEGLWLMLDGGKNEGVRCHKTRTDRREERLPKMVVLRPISLSPPFFTPFSFVHLARGAFKLPCPA